MAIDSSLDVNWLKSEFLLFFDLLGVVERKVGGA